MNYRCPSCRAMIGFTHALLEPLWCSACDVEMAATLESLPAACGNITVTVESVPERAQRLNRAQRRARMAH